MPEVPKLTYEEIVALFEGPDAEAQGNQPQLIKPERRLHLRPDLNAFLLLDKLLMPSPRDIVASVEHDEFFVDVVLQQLVGIATHEDILDLIRCGVKFDRATDSLLLSVCP